MFPLILFRFFAFLLFEFFFEVEDAVFEVVDLAEKFTDQEVGSAQCKHAPKADQESERQLIDAWILDEQQEKECTEKERAKAARSFIYSFSLPNSPFSRHTKMRMGKIIAHKMPIFRLSPKRLDTKPTNVGPEEQPTSPAKASNAYMAVPPSGKAFAAMLRVPGHIREIAKPQTAQPIRFTTGFGTKVISK